MLLNQLLDLKEGDAVGHFKRTKVKMILPPAISIFVDNSAAGRDVSIRHTVKVFECIVDFVVIQGSDLPTCQDPDDITKIHWHGGTDMTGHAYVDGQEHKLL